MNIIKLLEQIDCTEFEVKTFSALLSESRGASVLQLSKKLNLPRTTIYGHLNSLIKKGLVKKSLSEDGQLFFVENLESILDIYNEKIERLKNAKINFTDIIKNQSPEYGYQPKFTVYNSPEASRSIFRDILRSREEETYWFWPLKEMIKIIPTETFEWFNKERVKRDIWVNILWPPKRGVVIEKHPFLGPLNPKKSYRRIKILPDAIDQTLGYVIYGNKIAFISSNRENYGFIIDSQELSQTLKVQFDYFWKESKSIKI